MENIVQDIERLVRNGLIHVSEGKEFSSEKLIPVVDDRLIKTLELSSLSGFVDYVKNKIDIDSRKGKNIIVICSHKTVALCGEIQPETLARDVFVRATLSDSVNSFDFGQFMDSDTFIIKLRSLLVQNDESAKLINYSSRLSVENSLSVTDDGVGQSATVKRGISGALKANEVAPALVRLAPYRTFREVVQPESDFLFRMKQNGTSAPACALFEADGGSWKMQAMENIKSYLSQRIDDITIIS